MGERIGLEMYRASLKCGRLGVYPTASGLRRMSTGRSGQGAGRVGEESPAGWGRPGRPASVLTSVCARVHLARLPLDVLCPRSLPGLAPPHTSSPHDARQLGTGRHQAWMVDTIRHVTSIKFLSVDGNSLLSLPSGSGYVDSPCR